MAKVGPFLINPLGGTYCRITLDSGEKLLINHDKGGAKAGTVTIEVTRLLGLRSNRIFSCDLDSPAGIAVLGQLTRNARSGTIEATPLGAFVEYVRHCPSVVDVKARFTSLMSAA